MPTATVSRTNASRGTLPNVGSLSGFPRLLREKTRVTVTFADRLDAGSLQARLESLQSEGRTFVVRKSGDSYVISPARAGGRPGPGLLRLGRSMTPLLDDEYENGGRWQMERWGRLDGRSRTAEVTIRRVEFRHGHPRMYELGCHCKDCTEANRVAHRQYIDQHKKTTGPREYKHGAACYKRGCYCEAYKAANRERQRRHRERAKAAAARR